MLLGGLLPIAAASLGWNGIVLDQPHVDGVSQQHP